MLIIILYSRMKKLLCSLVVVSAMIVQVHAGTTVWITPTGAGSNSSWKPSVNASNFTTIDESVCNGNIDYVSTATTGARDSYAVSLASVPANTRITDIYIRPCLSQEVATGTTSIALFYRLNGVTSPLSTTYTITGTSSRNYQFTRFFPGSVQRTGSTTLEIGVQYIGGGTGARLSRIATVVGYAIPVPVTPTNLNSTVTATTTGGFVNLTWMDNANNETHYLVERSLNGVSYSNLVVLPINTTTFRTALLSTGTYYFRVRAYNSGGYSGYSNVSIINVAPLATVPLAPSGLSTTYASGTAIVYWNDNSQNENGFSLERSIDGFIFTPYTTVGANQPYYLETETVPGTYTYRVKAFNQVGSSAYSNTALYTVVALPPPLTPSLLMVSLASSTPTNLLPTLRWTDNSNNENGFTIERKMGINGTYSAVGSVPANTTVFFDMTANAAYSSYPNNGEIFSYFSYRVVAINNLGRSESLEALSYPMQELEVKNAPTNLYIFFGSSTPTTLLPVISWNDTSFNEAGFTIERQIGVSGEFTEVGTVLANMTSFTDFMLNDIYNANPTVAASVSYRVIAKNAFGQAMSNSAIVSPINELEVKNAPTDLFIFLGSSTPSTLVPKIFWIDTSNNEQNFIVERKVGISGLFTRIGTVPANVSNFIDLTANDAYNADPISATSFSYRVTATNNFGSRTSIEQMFSPINELEVKNAPTYLYVSLASSTPNSFVPDVYWVDNSNNEESFVIERKVGVSGTFVQAGLVPANTRWFRDFMANGILSADPVTATSFAYRITATNHFGSRTSTEIMVSSYSLR